MHTALGEAFDGPIDIIGDVHGELGALVELLKRLGYDASGKHPEGRRLVFVGDLVDRGPDSPGVLRLVASLVEADRARCVLGNHELNAINNRQEGGRPGEGWWYGRVDDGYASEVVDPDEKERVFLPFLRSLPVALEGERVRVVHACWDQAALAKVDRGMRVIDAFRQHEQTSAPLLAGLKRAADLELEQLGMTLRDGASPVPFLEAKAAYDEANQMCNPIRVLTSGVEASTEGRPFFASGKWRMVERVRWWEAYPDAKPVVFGHYWRRYGARAAPPAEKAAADMFAGTPPDAWLGTGMCIDYSVGYRFSERGVQTSGRSEFCLAALQIPEWRLVFDDGRPPYDLGPPRA